MPLIKSLLTAIVRVDGDALVMHTGEKPYVVTAAGNVDLSSAGLNLEAMSGMLTQLLPSDATRGLSEFGAVEHHLQPPAGMRDSFTVVAARGGDDIWIEIRRKRAVIPTEVHASPSIDLQLDVEKLTQPRRSPTAPDVSRWSDLDDTGTAADTAHPSRVGDGATGAETVPLVDTRALRGAPPPQEIVSNNPPAASETTGRETLQTAFLSQAGNPSASAGDGPPQSDEPPDEETGTGATPFDQPNVVPLTRTVRIELTPRTVSPLLRGVERLLHVAAVRGASVLYLTSESRPFLRIDGDIRAIENEPVLSSADIDAAVDEMMPETARAAYGRGEASDWIAQFEGVGRIRCTTFKDYRGSGAVVHLISAKPLSVDQLGLGREFQTLASETDGLVAVSAPRGGGKSTLVGALIDVINRQHGGYVVTIERQVRIVHDNRQSLISQREVGDADPIGVARAALRENPDVLVLEDLATPEMIQLALDAAGSGLLVFFTMTAGSTVSALARTIELFPADQRRAVKVALAERLRGAVSQVLLRKTGGGRVAARELLLSTSAVATLIGEGQFGQLPAVMESGRKLGMVSLNESLRQFVQSGTVDVREAYRKADDRSAFLALLKQDGVDTLFVERFA